MKRFSTKRLVALVASVCGALLLATATPATADATTGITTTQVAAAINAVERTNDKLIAEPVKSATDADSAAVTTQNGVTVDIPKNAKDGITLSRGNVQVTIGLPNAGTAGTAQRLADGTISYPSKRGASADAALPLTNGAQALNVIRSKDASENFGYTLRKASKGSRFVILKNGGAAIVDKNGLPQYVAPPAWAQDAKGIMVPTLFKTDGRTLTQEIKHRSEGVTYPVVADPYFRWYWNGVVVTLTPSDMLAVAYGGTQALAAMLAIPGIGWAAYAGVLGAAGWALWAYHNRQCFWFWLSPAPWDPSTMGTYRCR